jgi:HEAT repeat protein
MTVGLGRSAEPMLMRALAEGDTPVKLAAIHTLAHVGPLTGVYDGKSAIDLLRAQLAAPDPVIRGAAYQALSVISAKAGMKIPREAMPL